LEQVSVLPDYGRRGVGKLLVEAAIEEATRRGYDQMTLRTYAAVPWNGPFYALLGFAESEPETDFQRSLIDVENGLGLAQYGRRIQMTRFLNTPA
jgi:N-acetylglutamate synthase-like GNAT family acetyltransferase